MAKPIAYDLIIIGGGSAGLTAAETAILFGKKIALVAPQLGGDCLWTGCVPSKSMVSVALYAKEHGLSPDKAWQLVRQRVAKATETIRSEHDNAEFYRQLGIDVYEYAAKFMDPWTIRAGDIDLRASRILICTGSSPSVPNLAGLSSVPFLTNESIFELETLPKSMAIIGGGPIGCELGQALQRLGCSVTILQRGNRLIPKDEPEASKLIHSVFDKEGVIVHTNFKVSRASRFNGQVEIAGEKDGKEIKVHAESLLMATGRKPNLQFLDLENADVTYSDRGVQHNRYLQTSQKHIYVAGDVAGDFQFTHYASAQAGTAVQNMFVPLAKSQVTAVVPWCTFTYPEVAHSGMTEEDAVKMNIQHETFLFRFSNIDRAIIEDEAVGLIKLILGKRDRILGATIVGSHAGEIIQELTLAISKRMTVQELLQIIHIYPTYSSGIQQALFYRFKEKGSLLLKLGKLLSRIS